MQAGIYIHTPFCLTKCMYCDFYSIVGQENAIPRFVKALIKEIENGPKQNADWNFQTIFIGGGTPSLLTPEDINNILQALRRKYDISHVSEITLEANPGEAPLAKLTAFKDIGVNRISLGVQSFIPKYLDFLGRIHSANDVFKTVESIKKAGFTNFNLDLIHGIPGQTLSEWKNTLDQAVSLEPTHISAYNLTVEEKTTLQTLVKTGTVKMHEDDLQAEFISNTERILTDSGYEQYEISNFSRPGLECQHNLQYWKGSPYLSFGPSAHSFDGRYRWRNRGSLEFYIEQIEKDKSPIDFREELTDQDLINERLGFGIRLNRGIKIPDLPSEIQIKVKENLDRALINWPDHLIFNQNTIKLTEKGRLFADAIAVDLIL